jgi:serine/threonine protein kinase
MTCIDAGHVTQLDSSPVVVVGCCNREFLSAVLQNFAAAESLQAVTYGNGSRHCRVGCMPDPILTPPYASLPNPTPTKFSGGVRFATQDPHTLPHLSTQEGDVVVLVLEHAAAGDLSAVAATHPGGRLHEHHVIHNVLRPVLGALGALHSHGIVHRDIKPANICYTMGAQLRLIDFGWAIDTKAAKPCTRAGTPVRAPAAQNPLSSARIGQGCKFA